MALHRQKVQPYRTEVAKDAHRAEELRLQFEASVYTHAMVRKGKLTINQQSNSNA